MTRDEIERRMFGVLHRGQYILGQEVAELESRLAEFAEARGLDAEATVMSLRDTDLRTAVREDAEAGRARGGVTGTIGDFEYAIQGNLLSGGAVVFACEEAFRTTKGDMTERLMAAMEAARAFGGDGRCSCPTGPAPSCGSPPASFEKSAHIAYMGVARIGDLDGTCSPFSGCASGSYYLNFNVIFNFGK